MTLEGADGVAPSRAGFEAVTSERDGRGKRGTVALFVLLLGAAAIYSHGLGNYQIDGDEEGYSYAAWRVAEGEVPYGDFLTPQLPGFLYPGAVVVAAAGRNLVALRAWTVVAVLVAAACIFVAGRSLLGPGGGLLAAATFLLMDDVFGIGRAFRPEALMLAATTAALAVLVVTEHNEPAVLRAGESAAVPQSEARRRRRIGYACASLLFGAGMLTKLFAILPWAAACAFVAAEVLHRRRTWRIAVADCLLLVVPGAVLVSAVMGLFAWREPATYAAVIGHQLAQGAELGWRDVAAKTLAFFRSAAERYATLLAFVPAGIVGLRAVGGTRGWLVAWQFPTVIAFFFLSRELFDRHLVVLMPAVALSAAGAIVWFAQSVVRVKDSPHGRLGTFAVASATAVLLVPMAASVSEGFRGLELGTAAVAALTRALVPADQLVVSDTPGPAFHAGRRTTYTAAGLSEGAAHSGQITGAKLLAEMGPETALVLVDASPARGHLGQLGDYEVFRQALARDYDLLGHTVRADLRYDVYRAPGRTALGIIGAYEILGAAAPESSRAGDPIRVDMAWRFAPDPDRDSDAMSGFRLRLATLDNIEVAAIEVPAVDTQGRGRVTNAAPDEVLGLSLELPLPDSTPAGDYALQIQVTDTPVSTKWITLATLRVTPSFP